MTESKVKKYMGVEIQNQPLWDDVSFVFERDYDQLLEAFKRVVWFYGNPQSYKDTADASAAITDDMTNGPEDFGHLARSEAKRMGIVI